MMRRSTIVLCCVALLSWGCGNTLEDESPEECTGSTCHLDTRGTSNSRPDRFSLDVTTEPTSDAYGEDENLPIFDDVETNPDVEVQRPVGGNINPIARACGDQYRVEGGTCSPMSLKAKKYYVFNFSDIEDSVYHGNILADNGQAAVPGHPTGSTDPDGDIVTYCVRFFDGDAWQCHEGDYSFYKHFHEGETGVLSLRVQDNEGGVSELDSVAYFVE